MLIETRERSDSMYKILAILIIGGMILSLIPLFLLAKYNHSCADDYVYGLYARKAWLETGSLWEVVRAAAKMCLDHYNNWQGTFSSIFLMALQPAVFGEQYYVITPYLMLAMLILSTFSLFKTILIDYLKGSKLQLIIISFLFITVSIQLILSPVEAIYWYNGSVHYVFMYSSMLFMISSFLQYLNKNKYKYLCMACVLAGVVSGGNYITALTAILLICIIGGFIIIYRKKGVLIQTGIMLVFAIAGLIVSGLAPGNSIRQEFFEPPSAIKAVFLSFRDAVDFIYNQSHLIYFFVLLFLVPVIWNIVRQTKFSFKLPALVPVISFCLIAAMFFPTEYSMGVYYVGRTGNVILLMMQLLGVLNVIYILGWISQFHKRKTIKWISKIEKVSMRTEFIFYGIIMVFSFFIVFTTYKDKVTYTTISAMQSLYYGEAAAYDEQMRERMLILESNDNGEIELPMLQTRPYLLYFDDITGEKTDWRNVSMAEFWDKQSVILINEEGP